MQTTAKNPARTLDIIDEKLAATDDPALRRIYQVMRDRLVGELIGDLNLLLGTLAPEFTLVLRPAGQPSAETGPAEFRTAVERLCASDLMIWVDWDHLVVSHGVSIGDGVVTTLMSAAAAGAGDPGDPHAMATVSVPGVVVIEYTESGLMSREIFYSDPGASVTVRLAAGDAPTREETARSLGLKLS
ncbi:MAG: hypothetical protein JWN95_1211 [Frankiales bacterium]|nr:hypothetical protein [Frankiales bacterium]